MTDEHTVSSPSEPATKPAVWPRRLLLGGTVAVGLLAAGAVAAGGMMGDHGGWGGRGGWSEGEGWGHGRGHGMRHGMGHGPERIERMAGRALDFVDATPEQSEKINAIIKAQFDGFGGMREEMRDLRQSALELLRAPTIDRDGIEKLRAEHVARMEERSKAMVAAAIEAAEVLTPEQRAKLAGEFDRMRERRRGLFEE